MEICSSSAWAARLVRILNGLGRETHIYQNILNPKYEIEYPSRLSSEVVTDVSNFDRIESKVDFFAGEPYDFSDARQWDVDF